jgi:hypothetical protein
MLKIELKTQLSVYRGKIVELLREIDRCSTLETDAAQTNAANLAQALSSGASDTQQRDTVKKDENQNTTKKSNNDVDDDDVALASDNRQGKDVNDARATVDGDTVIGDRLRLEKEEENAVRLARELIEFDNHFQSIVQKCMFPPSSLVENKID